MSQEKKAKKPQTKKPKKMDNATKIIIGGLIIIAIPFLVLGYFLISASMGTGAPINGDRFKGDLNPAITKADMQNVENSIKEISGVESVEVLLKTATLRIYVDATDSSNTDTIKALAENAYDKLIEVLDANTYFAHHDGRKMYDLEIHVYNLAKDRDSDVFSYVITSKSSAKEEPITEIVSAPKDPELAQRLLDELEAKRNPTPTPDDNEMTVGGQETEGNETENEGGGE